MGGGEEEGGGNRDKDDLVKRRRALYSQIKCFLDQFMYCENQRFHKNTSKAKILKKCWCFYLKIDSFQVLLFFKSSSLRIFQDNKTMM